VAKKIKKSGKAEKRDAEEGRKEGRRKKKKKR
jgi:hypothetical protein